MFCGSGGSKSTLAKLYAVVARSTCDVRSTSGSSDSDVEKVHTAVARSMFPSQHVQKTPCSEHFWKLKCPKSTRGCGAKHISKSKCEKNIGALLEVAMFKKCTSLWREAHFEVKMRKAPQVSGHFSKFRCRKSARRFGTKHIRRSKVLKTSGLGALFEVKMSKKCTLLRREAHAEVKM